MTGQMTRIEMQNATALPTPWEVPRARWKLRWYLRVSKYRCIAVVHITRTRVVTCMWSPREYIRQKLVRRKHATRAWRTTGVWNDTYGRE